MSAVQLHLASASPRRREILTALGVSFSFAGEDVDERPQAGEPAAELVVRLARAKARAAMAGRTDVPILGADTVVVLDQRIFGKPASQEQALEMLATLSGRTHEVMTAVVLLAGSAASSVLCRSQVTFREISAADAAAYWQSGEPRDKAGGYAIQGLGGVFVRHLQGSYSGVVGLPVFETAALLRGAGIEVLQNN
jgi:nucleoside triphosphate pyrophosphatase